MYTKYMDKYVVAVSGGVDSVVLLDILSKHSGLELIVAHFDHGIRKDSAIDAVFVSGLARKYDLLFETKREELGPDSSEEMARTRRYKFLREVAKKHGAKLVTAHHGDDVVETIAINLVRGTGWRGLAVLDSDVVRLLTGLTKVELLDYATKHKLIWHEDSTNSETKYLRNRIRQHTSKLDEDKKMQLLGLWAEQKSLKRLIDKEVVKLVGTGPSYSRYFFIHIDHIVAIECLRHIVGARLTRPQLANMLHAIKTALPSKVYDAGGGVKVQFTPRNFIVELIK
jgi:tRNA(Ile)-lysidine synthetase-like protein